MGNDSSSKGPRAARHRWRGTVQQQLRFLAEASNILASSLDLQVTLQQAARLTVPIVADACVIYEVDARGECQAVAVAHVHPEEESVLWELQRSYPDPAGSRGALGRVLATRASVCFPDSRPAARIAHTRDGRLRELLTRLNTRSAMIVPLVARDKVLGALSLMTSTSGRRYAPRDVAFAEDLAARCALAVDNARLYDAAQHQIEQRERVEAALAESEQRYRLMVDEASDLVFRTDARGRYTFLNPAAKQILGSTPQQLLGRRPIDQTRSDWQAEVLAFYERQWRERLPTTYQEFPVVAADGTERWLGQNAQLVFQNGQPVGYQAIARDITERRRTQGALETLQALSASIAAAPTPAELADAVVEELATRFGYELPSVYLLEADGRLHLAAQRGYEQPVQTTPLDRGVVGRVFRTCRPALVDEIHLDSDFVIAAEGVVAQVCVPIVSHASVLGVVSIETRRRGVLSTHDVHLMTALSELMAVSLQNANLLRAAQEEIAERKRAQAEVAELARSKEELISMISHELRTPASVLVGYAELLQARQCSESEQREMVSAMVQQGRQLTKLMDDFLDIQRLGRGQLRVDPKPVDLRHVLERAVSAAPRDPSSAVLLEAPAGELRAVADEARIEQVLSNFLSNAHKYSPPGGSIRVKVVSRGSELEISVEDEGLGIPADALSHVFERFYRVQSDDRRAISGTGLGLAIARELVEAHGGTIGVESPGRGMGSRFWFTVPAAPPARLGSAEPTHSRPSAPACARRLRILAVDDEPAVGAMLRRALRSDGHIVDYARSTLEALQCLEQRPYDATIADLSLGTGADGLQLAEQVRTRWPAVRFVLASGCVQLDPAEARARGAHTVLCKPYDVDDLRAALSAAA